MSKTKDFLIEIFSHCYAASHIEHNPTKDVWNRKKQKSESKYKTVEEPVSAELLNRHFSDEDIVIGVSPHKEDGTCRWCVFDIDVDVKPDTLKHLLKNHQWPCIVFKSKSGRYHVYTFFGKPVDVLKVRSRMQEIMKGWPESIAAGTEIFPKEDTVENEPYKINLPLCKYKKNEERGMLCAVKTMGGEIKSFDDVPTYERNTVEGIDKLGAFYYYYLREKDTIVVERTGLPVHKVTEQAEGRNRWLYLHAVNLRVAGFTNDEIPDMIATANASCKWLEEGFDALGKDPLPEKELKATILKSIPKIKARPRVSPSHLFTEEELLNRFTILFSKGAPTYIDEKPDYGDQRYSFFNYQGFKAFMQPRYVSINGKPIPAATAFMNSQRRREYHDVTIAPLGKEPPGSFNLFPGLPESTIANPDISPVLDLLDKLFQSNQEYIDWFLDFIAEGFQNAGKQGPGISVTLKSSGHGVGKSFIQELIAMAIGEHNVFTGDASHKELSDFNWDVCTSTFILTEDAFIGGDHRSAEIRKSFITARYRVVNEKYVPRIQLPAVQRILDSTNSDNPVHVEIEDRRYVIFDVVDHWDVDSKTENKPARTAYFAKLREWREEEGAAHFRAAMLQRPIDMQRLINKPETQATYDLKKRSSVIADLLMTMAETGEIYMDINGTGQISFQELREFAGVRNIHITARDVGSELASILPEIKNNQSQTKAADAPYWTNVQTYSRPRFDMITEEWKFEKGNRVKGAFLGSPAFLRKRLEQQFSVTFDTPCPDGWSAWSPEDPPEDTEAPAFIKSDDPDVIAAAAREQRQEKARKAEKVSNYKSNLAAERLIAQTPDEDLPF